MAILRGFLGTKGRFVGVLGLPPQKEMPIIRGHVRGNSSRDRGWMDPPRECVSSGSSPGEGRLVHPPGGAPERGLPHAEGPGAAAGI